MTRPVLFLDVDGVINVLPKYNRQLGDFDFDAMTEDWDDLVTFQVSDGGGRMWPMRFSASMGTALHRLTDRIEIRWLTTWADKANERIAPLVGLPGDYEVAAYPPPYWSSRPWKHHAVEQFTEDEPGRPFIWIDDDAIDSWAIAWAADMETPHLLIPCDGGRGITKDDFRRIEEFVNGLED